MKHNGSRQWVVEVTKRDEPDYPGPHVLHINSKNKMFMYNDDTVVLTEDQIQTLNDACVETEVPIQMESPMWGNPAEAKRQNPTMKYVEREGWCYLVKKSPRFTVSRIRPVQETIEVSEEDVRKLDQMEIDVPKKGKRQRVDAR